MKKTKFIHLSTVFPQWMAFLLVFILSISLVPTIVFKTNKTTAPASAWPTITGGAEIYQDDKGYYIEAGYFPQKLVGYNGDADVSKQGNIPISTWIYMTDFLGSRGENPLPMSWDWSNGDSSAYLNATYVLAQDTGTTAEFEKLNSSDYANKYPLVKPILLPSYEEIVLPNGEPALELQQAEFEVMLIKWYLSDQSGS